MKKLSKPAQKLLRGVPDIKSAVHISNMRLVAQLTLHVSHLGDDQLDALPRKGVILFNPDELRSYKIDFDSLAVKVLGLDDTAIRQVVSGPLRALAPRMFELLDEWPAIERHFRNQPIATWETLDRQDRIACVATMLNSIDPYEMLLERPYSLMRNH